MRGEEAGQAPPCRASDQHAGGRAEFGSSHEGLLRPPWRSVPGRSPRSHLGVPEASPTRRAAAGPGQRRCGRRCDTRPGSAGGGAAGGEYLRWSSGGALWHRRAGTAPGGARAGGQAAAARPPRPRPAAGRALVRVCLRSGGALAAQPAAQQQRRQQKRRRPLTQWHLLGNACAALGGAWLLPFGRGSEATLARFRRPLAGFVC
mmetsp:Transcript_81884/g.226979  ORF Transcript_81884/g.226979 Transcript_81884/m.226979 type:complete len:204 (+) Transcript_81884:737-1348(+)